MTKEKSSLLPRISVSRPVTVVMCLLALTVVGAVSYSRIRLQAFPSGQEWKRLWVWVDWPDASPQEKEVMTMENQDLPVTHIDPEAPTQLGIAAASFGAAGKPGYGATGVPGYRESVPTC